MTDDVRESEAVKQSSDLRQARVQNAADVLCEARDAFRLAGMAVHTTDQIVLLAAAMLYARSR